ncbi:MAG TPA: DUF951 domain-containing protein [Firmicutes bacterium]|jgi:hypothetical protein|nr:DUF951 domain-containing protein [Bacillota bacterium]
MSPLKFNVGDIVKMKKPHPCGGNTWEVMRVGMDFRIRCLTCDRVVMIPRVKFEKGLKEIVKSGNEETNQD